MNDTWDSADIDAAKAELMAAGWVPKTPTLWKSPTGKLHLGPAGAWKVMKRQQNDDRCSMTVPLRINCAACGQQNVAPGHRCEHDRPKLPEGTPRCLAESWCARPAGHPGRCIGRVEQMTDDGSIGTGPDLNAKYLNSTCATDGCQFLQKPTESDLNWVRAQRDVAEEKLKEAEAEVAALAAARLAVQQQLDDFKAGLQQEERPSKAEAALCVTSWLAK